MVTAPLSQDYCTVLNELMILKPLEQCLAKGGRASQDHHHHHQFDLEQVTVHHGVKFPHQSNDGEDELILGRSPLA